MDIQLAELPPGDRPAAISSLTVAVYANHVGKAPENVRSWTNDDLVLCLVEGALTHAERSLIEAGREKTALKVRAGLHEEMRAELIAGIEEMTGCGVAALIGGANLDPDVAVQLFVLDDSPEG